MKVPDNALQREKMGPIFLFTVYSKDLNAISLPSTLTMKVLIKQDVGPQSSVPEGTGKHSSY